MKGSKKNKDLGKKEQEMSHLEARGGKTTKVEPVKKLMLRKGVSGRNG
jgi:hypothetical protein